MKLAPVHLPLGISFFTFHAISYVVDIHRHKTRGARPLDFALYMTLFPHSIAGPIVRYGDIAGQIAHRVVTTAGFAEGIRRFIIGLAKKMLVANTVAVAADAIFALPGRELNFSLAWLGVAATRCRSTSIFRDTRTWPSGWPSSSASISSRTSTTPTRPARSPISGGAGTSHSRAGFATICTSRSGATDALACGTISIW